MACEGFETRLIEKALADTDPALIAHLAKCADCREELAAQRALQERITNGIAAMVADEPPPGLLTRVRAQIASEAAPRSANWRQWAATGLAITAFAAVAIWMIGRPSSHLTASGDLAVRSAKNAPAASTPGPERAGYHQSAPIKPTVAREHCVVHRASHPEVPAVTPANPELFQLPATVTANNQPAEIIVPAGQREAVARLVNALRTGRVDAASLIRSSQSGTVAPLAIAPLEVKPLEGGGGEGGPENEFDIEF